MKSKVKVNSWNVKPKHALAMNRHILVSHFGHMAALAWARLTLSHFRDAVLPDFQPPSGSGEFFISFSLELRCGGYRGRYFPGA